MKKKPMNKLKTFIYFFIGLNILVSVVLLKNQGSSVNVLGAALATAENAVEGKVAAEGTGEKEASEESMDAPDEKKEAEEVKLVLDGLEEKRIQLQKQEDRIKTEQEKLNALKQELEDKMAELEKTHSLINESLAKLEKKKSDKELLRLAAEDKKIKQLVKVYANMKPKQAGEIINNMDIVIAEKIFLNMKGEAAGKILSYVESSKAALISERLAVTIGRNEPNL
ncbi:MAG: hypothetical protein KKD44_10915 [Proteobacteria bacterium]|nr:hypothetical protein [Pseudomonadota bacterium]